MLSTENPADPSCSSKPSALETDERAPAQLPFQEADPLGLVVQTHTPNFSIRDYVFASRSKGIETNWPFPQNLLQLCLKHGISDLLPPFEPPDVVRSHCQRKVVETKAEELSAKICSLEIQDVGLDSIGTKSCSPCDELVVASSEQNQSPLPEEGKLAVDDVSDCKLSGGDTEIASTVTSDDQIEQISSHIGDLKVAKLPSPSPELEISQEPSEKKCRLVLKLSSISEARRAEDIVSTSSTVSDSMASKVCPVCKTFSSTSNTTLNAHIDQCLSVESNTRRVMTNLSKLKVKPRKKRLMEDIYATAPYCTLEDLDRRNGTTWATDLALAASAGETCTETKRPKLSPAVTRDDGDGAVYVDSNGIKLRILSKFNDAPPVVPREESKMRKHAKEIKEGKSLMINKKKCFATKHLKYIKGKPQSKKLSSVESLDDEMEVAPEGDIHAATSHGKEQSPLQTFSACDQVRSCATATLGQWVCSKRSDLPKKIIRKDICKSLESPKDMLRNPLLGSSQPDSSDHLASRSHILKFSRSNEDSASPKTKRIDCLQTFDNEKKSSRSPPLFSSRWSSESTSTSSLMLKLSKTSGTSTPSLKSRREEFRTGNLATRPLKKIGSLKNFSGGRPSHSLEPSNGDVSQKISKKFRKHRSMLVASKRGGELASHGNEAGKTISSHAPNTTSPRTEGTMEQMYPGSKIPESEQGEEALANEEFKRGTLQQVCLNTECHDTEVAIDSMGNTVCDHVRSETLNADNMAMNANLNSDPKPSGEHNMHSILESESHEELAAQRLVDKHEMQCCDATRGENTSQNIHATDDVDSHAVHCVESQAETVSAQESSACLTSHHGDMGIEIPQENSSITSIRIIADQNRTSAFEREPSLSPASTASTVSPPSRNGSQTKDSGPQISERPTSDGGTQRRDTEGKKHEVEMVSVPKEPEQPCCCSRRCEYQFLRQNIMAGTLPPTKGKHVSNLYISPTVSPFGSYPSLRTELPTESITTRVSSDCSGLNSPTQTQQSSPNPILRLMGKNLMVVNKEESAQLPKVQPLASDNLLSPSGFASYGSVLTQERFWYPHQLPNGCSSVLGHPSSMPNHQIPFNAGYTMKSDRQTHQKKLSRKPVVSSSRTPYTMKEVIVIDDSPESEPELKPVMQPILGSNPMLHQRPFSCFPSQGQYIMRDVAGGFRPPFPNTPLKRGNPIEGLRPPLLPSPFVFRSPTTGHLGPSMYYSQTLG